MRADSIARSFQHFFAQDGKRCFVIDKKNALTSSFGNGGGLACDFGGARFESGKIETEGGSTTRLAGDRDRPFVRFHDAMHDGEAEAGAFSGRFCGEERLKYSLQRRPVHAASGIAYGQSHVIAYAQIGMRSR